MKATGQASAPWYQQEPGWACENAAPPAQANESQAGKKGHYAAAMVLVASPVTRELQHGHGCTVVGTA